MIKILSPKAEVYIEPDQIILRKCHLNIIFIDKNGWLEVTGMINITTRKTINAFLKEYAPALHYDTIKALYAHNQKINTFTGEVVDL